MSNEARVQEIARIIKRDCHAYIQSEEGKCVDYSNIAILGVYGIDEAARAIAPLIEAARAEGERDMRERCKEAAYFNGRILEDGAADDIPAFRKTTDVIVSAISALPMSSDTTDALAQPGSAPQKGSQALLQGRALPHLGSSESCSDDARVQIPQASAKSEATQGAGTAQPNGPPRPRGPLNFTPIG